jgi:transposase-like protein
VPCVRWYLHFQVSYRDQAEIAGELGVFVAPSRVYTNTRATSRIKINVSST